jgi:tetratricopeptide (TPR) repeat protein
LADLYREKSQYPKAQEAALDAKKIAPANLQVLQTVANVYIAAGKRDDAKYVYGQMRGIALDQSDANALYAIAERQASMSLLQDSVETLSIALEYNPQSVLIQTRLAEMLLKTGQIELAENLIGKVLKDSPKQSEGQRLKGDLLVHKGKLDASIKPYRQAVAMDNNDDNALALGLSYSRLGKSDKAVSVLKAVKGKNRFDQRIGVALTELYMQRGEFANASKTLEGLLSTAPNQPLLLNNLANVYDLLSDKRALDTSKKAYGLAPKNSNINDTYGWLLTKAGQAEIGLPLLREAHIRDSDNLEVRYHIAATLNKLGRSKEALKELTEVLNSQRAFISIEKAKNLKGQLE